MATMLTKTIVIKIKDEFFLQQNSPNLILNKIDFGSNFFAMSNRINILYPLINQNNSPNLTDNNISVFNNLITYLGNVPNPDPNVPLKLKSLFAVIDATLVVDLMEKAKNRRISPNLTNGFIGRNLLNYYSIRIKVSDPPALMTIIDQLKSLPGVDFVYIRGELSNLEKPRRKILVDRNDIFEAIQGEAAVIQDKFLPIENLQEPPASLDKKSEIVSLLKSELADKTISKFEEMKPDENIIQNKQAISFLPPPPPPPIKSINEKIKDLFAYCKINTDSLVDKQIQVVDFEQGWDFINNDNSRYPNLANSTIFGGGINKPEHKTHGQSTLNILFGKVPPPIPTSRIDGLCKGATAKIASSWFGNNDLDRQPEPALVKTLVDSGIGIGDIVLLEVQLNRWMKSNLPVEMETAFYDVAKAGVQAGYIIIEAAGNGRHQLNTLMPFFTSTTTSTMTTENPPVNLSQNGFGTGSIMVGGRKKDLSIDNVYLNHGNRIDYYCFGEYDPINNPADPLTSSGLVFNSTSLASAITTALVARFQSQALTTISRRLTITEIKKLLGSIPYPGTPSSFAIPTSFQHFLSSRGITQTQPVPPMLP